MNEWANNIKLFEKQRRTKISHMGCSETQNHAYCEAYFVVSAVVQKQFSPNVICQCHAGPWREM